MIRLLLAVGLAISALFAPWEAGGRTGAVLLSPVGRCLQSARWHASPLCLPEGGVIGLTSLTVAVLALFCATVHLLALVKPLRGRGGVTAIVTGAAGVLGVILILATDQDYGWGVWAAGLFGSLLGAAGAVRLRARSRGAAGSKESTPRSLRS
ncbi:hypothetical protein [Parvularcula dongshanensis]|uniref:Uncharacterized protein n=1 Tax=Parvularcula dongshanensis TaxID=1173995 RepID=A0A840I6N6_9PROT|nr:hypothetical protein [Parvularcula dongshanensis]MBB4659788.1 hypothetical protein [Parvularcula dongshanensis]